MKICEFLIGLMICVALCVSLAVMLPLFAVYGIVDVCRRWSE